MIGCAIAASAGGFGCLLGCMLPILPALPYLDAHGGNHSPAWPNTFANDALRRAKYRSKRSALRDQ
jgi:hypothetical protein